MSSNLHKDLDEANKHTPKGFDPAVNNTEPWKDELGTSTYTEKMQLPKAINFVDGTIAPPTTADLDIYVLIGAGSVDAGWGVGAAFGDWVRFQNSTPTSIVPLAGYLCYDSTALQWMEYSGTTWLKTTNKFEYEVSFVQVEEVLQVFRFPSSITAIKVANVDTLSYDINETGIFTPLTIVSGDVTTTLPISLAVDDTITWKIIFSATKDKSSINVIGNEL